jgi:hypothetical protein
MLCKWRGKKIIEPATSFIAHDFSVETRMQNAPGDGQGIRQAVSLYLLLQCQNTLRTGMSKLNVKALPQHPL